jgi:hypothetical protein
VRDRYSDLSPLSNALPEDLATEVARLLDPRTGIAGDVRSVDGGYNIWDERLFLA